MNSANSTFLEFCREGIVLAYSNPDLMNMMTVLD